MGLGVRVYAELLIPKPCNLSHNALALDHETVTLNPLAYAASQRAVRIKGVLNMYRPLP